MPAVVRTKDTRYIGESFQSSKGYIVVDSFAAPAAAANTGILAATTQPTSGTTVVTTGITNPDMPRVVRLKGNQATCTGNAVIAGTDRRGNSVSDTIAANGTSAVDGLVAFATITSITIPTRGAASDTLSFGPGAALGLSRICTANLGVAGTADNVKEATAPTFVPDATIGKTTVAFNTAPNGAKNFTAAYITRELYAGAN